MKRKHEMQTTIMKKMKLYQMIAGRKPVLSAPRGGIIPLPSTTKSSVYYKQTDSDHLLLLK